MGQKCAVVSDADGYWWQNDPIDLDDMPIYDLHLPYIKPPWQFSVWLRKLRAQLLSVLLSEPGEEPLKLDRRRGCRTAVAGSVCPPE